MLCCFIYFDHNLIGFYEQPTAVDMNHLKNSSAVYQMARLEYEPTFPGHLTCSARNSVGISMKRVAINFLDQHESIFIATEPLAIYRGDNVTINCYASTKIFHNYIRIRINGSTLASSKYNGISTMVFIGFFRNISKKPWTLFSAVIIAENNTNMYKASHLIEHFSDRNNGIYECLGLNKFDSIDRNVSLAVAFLSKIVYQIVIFLKLHIFFSFRRASKFVFSGPYHLDLSAGYPDTVCGN